MTRQEIKIIANMMVTDHLNGDREEMARRYRAVEQKTTEMERAIIKELSNIYALCRTGKITRTVARKKQNIVLGKREW